MIHVNNLSLRYGKRVLFEEVNLKFTPATVMASLARMEPENPLF